MATGKDMTIRELEAAIREAKKEVRRRVWAHAKRKVPVVDVDVERMADPEGIWWEVSIRAKLAHWDLDPCAEGIGEGKTPAAALKMALRDLTDEDSKSIPKEFSPNG